MFVFGLPLPGPDASLERLNDDCSGIVLGTYAAPPRPKRRGTGGKRSERAETVKGFLGLDALDRPLTRAECVGRDYIACRAEISGNHTRVAAHCGCRSQAARVNVHIARVPFFTARANKPQRHNCDIV
jgi:hypothetical protein